MSRLSKKIREIKAKLSWSTIVTWLVKFVEGLIGGGNGDIKHALVLEIIAVIVKYLTKLGIDVPDNVKGLADELIQTNVSNFNETGYFSHTEDGTEVPPPEPAEEQPEPKKRTRRTRAQIEADNAAKAAAAGGSTSADDDLDLTDIDLDEDETGS